jgi:hypothetical protein
MITYSFIGSDKNAGKTTALVFVYRRLMEQENGRNPVCLTSIGINGESVDAYENRVKPSIPVQNGGLFVTAGEHLSRLKGMYAVLHTFSGFEFNKTYVLARALCAFSVILEGPNDRAGVLKMKEVIGRKSEDCICLIDGSIDRQYIGHPTISDGICFALLLSSRPEQLTKAEDLLHGLTLKRTHKQTIDLINRNTKGGVKSILFDEKGKILYRGAGIPFLDSDLKDICLEHKNKSCTLYLDGSLPRSLYAFFAPFRNLLIVLDNFTQYQNISTQRNASKKFQPRLELYHGVPLHSLYLKEEGLDYPIRLPLDVPVYNLFRDDLYEIGI